MSDFEIPVPPSLPSPTVQLIGEPRTIVFVRDDGKVVFTIDQGGRLIAGDGLSNDEATRQLFDVMARAFPYMMSQLASSPNQS